MNYNNPPKKTNWGMIILIIILIPILILGTLFGMKYLEGDNDNAQTPQNTTPTTQNISSSTPQNNVQQQHSDFVKTFEGKLNNKYEVTMKITANNGQISGAYFYNSVGKDLSIKGTIDPQGNIKMSEYDDKGNQTGQFSGRLSNGSKMEGTWSKPNGKSTMPFLLSESQSDYNAKKQNSSANTINVNGNWSNEGDVSATGRLELELKMTGPNFNGIASYKDYSSGSQSGICDIDGTINGNKATFKIISTKGAIMGTGTLTKDGKDLKFNSNSSAFPSEIYLYKQ